MVGVGRAGEKMEVGEDVMDGIEGPLERCQGGVCGAAALGRSCNTSTGAANPPRRGFTGSGVGPRMLCFRGLEKLAMPSERISAIDDFAVSGLEGGSLRVSYGTLDMSYE